MLSFGDINRLIATTMTGNTASFRFPGQLNTDLNKLSYSLRCRSFLHFYIPSYAPLTALKSQKYETFNVSELVKQMAAEESNKNMYSLHAILKKNPLCP